FTTAFVPYMANCDTAIVALHDALPILGLGCRGLTGSSACRKPPPFKLDRTEVPKSRVAASSVIKHLDVVEDSGSKLHPCHPSLPVEKFCLQRSEETDRKSVV